MKYVIGIDLGSSAVKAVLVDRGGIVHQTCSRAYPLIHEQSGYSEQDPEWWYEKTTELIAAMVRSFKAAASDIEGISFSGQMHGLVLLDDKHEVLRNAILWNDTRTSEQCAEIYRTVGEQRLVALTKNQALEGFTLPKLLWVQQHEPEIFEKARMFLLPKDYLRFRMTGQLHTDYSDAAGTLLLDVENKQWSTELCARFGITQDMCPPLLESHDCVGPITAEFAMATGLSESTQVFAGGADNACGAIGAGILSEGKALCSIGTSGVILSFENPGQRDYQGKLHYFNHGLEDAYYSMGVTLAAGHSLSWFRETFAQEESFESLMEGIEAVPLGANGLLFTPYLSGERTPHANAAIRASFIGVDAYHGRQNFVRAVLEGVTFSLKETVELMRSESNDITTIISIGGGAKNEVWLQMQADIFNATIISLANEQGPALGAAMLACYGSGWYDSLQDCARVFISYKKAYKPIEANVARYEELFGLYQDVYVKTQSLSEGLKSFV